MINRTLKVTIFCCTCLLLISGCKKWIEVPSPLTYSTSESVYGTNEGAISQVTGLYTAISNTNLFNDGILSISSKCGQSADEICNGYLVNDAYFRNQLLSTTQGCWGDSYNAIFKINHIITGLQGAITFEEDQTKLINKNVKNQLLGEALFMRAFYYFYLVQQFGDVPLITTTDFNITSNLPRTPKSEVYLLMVKDLLTAQTFLNDGYVERDVITSKITSPRVRPNKWAAKALLSRVYLYMEQWLLAEQLSSEVIKQNSMYSLKTSLNDVFLANNSEAIWQIQPTVTGINTAEAWGFIIPSGFTVDYPYYINPRLMAAFEAGDNRRASWTKSILISGVTYFYPFKYKSATLNAPVTEYSTLLRLAELYLICAEARARQGNVLGTNSAATMVNAIRNRAGLGNIAVTTQEDMINAILKERQIELFSEFGHRWFDLKRTGKINSVMQIETPLKSGVSWDPNQSLYPIPMSEIQLNPALIQNPGY